MTCELSTDEVCEGRFLIRGVQEVVGPIPIAIRDLLDRVLRADAHPQADLLVGLRAIWRVQDDPVLSELP